MTAGRVIKIVLGMLILFAGLGNIPGMFQMRNAAEAKGYFAVTFLFILIGSFLIYSGVRQKSSMPSITGDE